MEAQEFIQPLKDELLNQYDSDELITRLLLKIYNLDENFHRKSFPQNFEYLAINLGEKDEIEGEVDIAKELNIPDKYVFVKESYKLILSVRKDEKEQLIEKYLTGVPFEILKDKIAQKQYIKKQFKEKAKMYESYKDDQIFFRLLNQNFNPDEQFDLTDFCK